MRRKVLAGLCVAAGAGFFGGVIAERRSAARAARLAALGSPHWCDERELPHSEMVAALRAVVGPEHVLTSGPAFEAHLRGMRVGQGEACAVAAPGSLAEAVRVLEVCAAARVPVFAQGRNTGLTGGSVARSPRGVALSMARLRRMVPLDGEGRQVLCLAGAGIQDLGQLLAGRFGRDSHTVLGSSFLNPTVAAGVALGSGGVQLRKGPTYTERLLYARVTERGEVEVVDTLGLALPPGVSALQLLDGGAEDLRSAPGARPASDAARYARALAAQDGAVTRFNADTRGPEPVRSEGHVLVLASVHDSFARPASSETLWIATDSFDACRELRDVLLQSSADLPSSCEYMNRDAIHVVQRAGRACNGLVVACCLFIHFPKKKSVCVCECLWGWRDAGSPLDRQDDV